MPYTTKNKMLMHHLVTATILIATCFLIYGIIEALIIKYNGTYVPAPNIPRGAQTLGTGPKLTYVVMGDSTTIGQGAEYTHSYPLISAQHLATNYTVTFVNTGISGAKIEDVISAQLDQTVALKPDIVLLGVGANDTTHFTNLDTIRSSFEKIINELRQANPDVRIIATRSPALDSVSRFPLIAKQILRVRTAQVNDVFDSVIAKNGITPALIAEKTRDAFIADPTLTAKDNFHPNARGYSLWVPIINSALDEALAKKPIR